MKTAISLLVFSWLIPSIVLAAPPKLDETPAGDEQWGYRPADGGVSATTPPSFSWRPQKGIVAWELRCQSRQNDVAFEYRKERLELNVCCPERTFPPGTYT